MSDQDASVRKRRDEGLRQSSRRGLHSTNIKYRAERLRVKFKYYRRHRGESSNEHSPAEKQSISQEKQDLSVDVFVSLCFHGLSGFKEMFSRPFLALEEKSHLAGRQ